MESKILKKNFALGVDIGGTNTVYGIVDKHGDIYYETTTKTAAHGDMLGLIETIYKDSTIQKYLPELFGIGVGAPNGNNFTGTIDFAPNLPWHGIIPLQKYFEDTFKLKCLITNDANAAAVGEMIFGNAKDLKDFVIITLGTGVGSGIIINGELVYGHDGFAGEFGHIRVVPNGRKCGCGRFGCLETYTSATGIVRSFDELESPNKALSTLSKTKPLSAKIIFDEAKNGDLFAKEIVSYTAKILGSALADFTCFSSPKAYVLFGGVAQAGNDFISEIKSNMEINMLNIYQNKVELRVSSLIDKNAAVLGSAAMAFKAFY
jgi:glucokinase